MIKSKYGNIKTTIDGIAFDSRAESEYYLVLKGMKKAGSIKELVVQPKVFLTDAKILYKPDFFVVHSDPKDGESYYDVKGFCTPVFNLKAKLWKYYGKGKLILVKKEGKLFTIKKVIITAKRGL